MNIASNLLCALIIFCTIQLNVARRPTPPNFHIDKCDRQYLSAFGGSKAYCNNPQYCGEPEWCEKCQYDNGHCYDPFDSEHDAYSEYENVNMEYEYEDHGHHEYEYEHEYEHEYEGSEYEISDGCRPELACGDGTKWTFSEKNGQWSCVAQCGFGLKLTEEGCVVDMDSEEMISPQTRFDRVSGRVVPNYHAISEQYNADSKHPLAVSKLKNGRYELIVDTQAPTQSPTESPTPKPTRSPTTSEPTQKPTQNPTKEPTNSPTNSPTTKAPTNSPTQNPTNQPTSYPTSSPTVPTASPTLACPQIRKRSICEGPIYSQFCHMEKRGRRYVCAWGAVTSSPTKSPVDPGSLQCRDFSANKKACKRLSAMKLGRGACRWRRPFCVPNV